MGEYSYSFSYHNFIFFVWMSIYFNKKTLIKILSLIIATGLTYSYWINILGFDNVINNGFMIVWFLISLLCIFIIRYSLKSSSKRTPYGLEMFEKISGFKKFLESSQEDKIKELMSINPNYLYEMLSYAFALEVEDKWIAKFKDITLYQPSWYLGFDEFNVKSFCGFIKSVMFECADYNKSDSDNLL